MIFSYSYNIPKELKSLAMPTTVIYHRLYHMNYNTFGMLKSNQIINAIARTKYILKPLFKNQSDSGYEMSLIWKHPRRQCNIGCEWGSKTTVRQPWFDLGLSLDSVPNWGWIHKPKDKSEPDWPWKGCWIFFKWIEKSAWHSSIFAWSFYFLALSNRWSRFLSDFFYCKDSKCLET